MRKSLTAVFGLAVLASMTSSAWAQVDSTLWLDIRDNSAGAEQTIFSGAAKAPWKNGDGDGDLPFSAVINGGAAGGGQILRLSPVSTNNMHLNSTYGATGAWPNYDTDNLLSTGNLYLYWTVNANNDTTPGVNDVMTSLGLNLNTTQVVAGVPRNTISSVAFQLYNSGVAGVTSGSPWNNKNDGTASGTSWTGAKAVRIPVTSGPVFAASLGVRPSATPYKIGQLRVTAGARNCSAVAPPNTHSKKSSYNINMQVNNLLVTRAFSSGGDSPHNEKLALGYTAAGATELANASGSVQNATSTVADAIVQVRLKGDTNGDGFTNAIDIAGFNAAVTASTAGTLNVLQTYLFDFNNNRTVNATDVAGMNTAVALSPTCP